MSSQSRIKITLALTKSFFAPNILSFWVIFWEDYVTVLGSKGVLRDECLNSSVCFTGSVPSNPPKTLWRRSFSPLTREHWGSKGISNQVHTTSELQSQNLTLCLPGSKTHAHFKLVCSFFNDNKYLHLNLFHVVTRNQMFNPCKVQIHLMFYFSSWESEICFAIASSFGSNGGKEVDNSDNDKDKGRWDNNSHLMSSSWFGHAKFHMLAQEAPMTWPKSVFCDKI